MEPPKITPPMAQAVGRVAEELGKQGPDGLFLSVMFAIAVAGAVWGADRWVLLGGLTICCGAFLYLRHIQGRREVDRAALKLAEQGYRVAAIKEQRRAMLDPQQGELPLEQHRRRRVPGDDS